MRMTCISLPSGPWCVHRETLAGRRLDTRRPTSSSLFDRSCWCLPSSPSVSLRQDPSCSPRRSIPCASNRSSWPRISSSCSTPPSRGWWNAVLGIISPGPATSAKPAAAEGNHFDPLRLHRLRAGCGRYQPRRPSTHVHLEEGVLGPEVWASGGPRPPGPERGPARSGLRETQKTRRIVTGS